MKRAGVYRGDRGLRVGVGLLVLILAACDRTPRPPEAAVAANGGPAFVDRAETFGIVFRHLNGMSGEFYLAEIMGAGAALLDYDNDGDLDVYLVQGGKLGHAAHHL